MTSTPRRRGLAAPLALPAGFAALLAVGALAAATGGWVGATGVLVRGGTGVLMRRIASSFTLWIVDVPEGRWPPADPANEPPERQLDAEAGQPELTAPVPPQPRRAGLPRRRLLPAGLPRRWARGVSGLSSGIGGRRLLAGGILVARPPALTAALVAGQRKLSLADDLLMYLVAVVAVAVVGGFWPAVLAAVTSSLLLNWYFTRPVHTLTIADPQNLLALMLFVTVAVTVSSVVHLAAHRAQQAARSSDEAAELLALAQTVLGGADTPAAVLEHLAATCGGRAELLELAGGQGGRGAGRGTAPPGATAVRVEAPPGLALVVRGLAGQP